MAMNSLGRLVLLASTLAALAAATSADECAAAVGAAECAEEDPEDPLDEEAELMSVQLIQSQLSMRRARAKRAAHELLDEVLGGARPIALQASGMESGTELDPVFVGAAPDAITTEVGPEEVQPIVSWPSAEQAPELWPWQGAFRSSMWATLAHLLGHQKFWADVEHLTEQAWQDAKSVGASALAIRLGSAPSFLLFSSDDVDSGESSLAKWRIFMPWGIGGLLAQKPELGEDGITFQYLLDVRQAGLGDFGFALAVDCAVVILIGALYIHLWKQPPHQPVVGPHVSSPNDADSGNHQYMGSFYGTWRYDLCSCLDAPEICCCACLCPGVRWGETMSYVPALSMFRGQESYPTSSFWAWLLLYMAFSACTSVLLFPLHDVSRVLLLPAALACFRSRLRGRFGMSAGVCVWLWDCVLYSCCPLCALTQDARHVEDARRHGLDECLVGDAVSEWDSPKEGCEKPTSA